MIAIENNVFHIQTKNTSYIFYKNEAGYLMHAYYGRRLDQVNIEALKEPSEFGIGNGIVDRTMPGLALENSNFEVSTIGKGDIREHFVEIVDQNNCYVNQFTYETHQILKEYDHPDMPYAKANGKETVILQVEMKDPRIDVTLQLFYQIFEDSDVIVKWSSIQAHTQPITLKRLMSSQLDLEQGNYYLSSLSGRWIHEANLTKQEVINQIVIDSKCGVSSSRHNPFFFIENQSDVYGFNLIYSGNHKNIIEKNSFGKVRVLQGVSDFHFHYPLEKGEAFTSPQAVITYSHKGIEGMQQQFHGFILDHIIPKQFAQKERPILINSWEANYFHFNEGKLLKLASAAKKIGVELFVLDDGWFADRNNDKSSLGDWVPNEKKLPNGIRGLAEKINALGLEFGLWMEPEMISVDSELYRNHPEYAIKVDENFHLGRNQLVLDLSNPEVVDYVYSTIYDLLKSASISYVKWDMNRILSDMYGSTLPHQGMLFHEYVKGLASIQGRLSKAFPEILFENCSAGGNRFDLGMLCVSPQIWASDNSDGYERSKIQKNLLLGYPQSTMGAHVSADVNHQTLRRVPLASRFHVSCFGVLGYELNLVDLKSQQLAQLKDQIAFYKQHRDLFQYGTIEVTAFDQYIQYNVMNQEKTKGAIMIMQGLATPHNPTLKIKYPFLLKKENLKVTSIQQPLQVKDFGNLIDSFLPIHIKQEGVIHRMIDQHYKLETEVHEFMISNQQLQAAGFYLPEAFSGIGYHDSTRIFKDFDSRMYIIE